MFTLFKDCEPAGTFDTWEQANEARIKEADNFIDGLYDNDDIDKYALQDWKSGVRECKEDYFYIDEYCGCSLIIEEKK